MDIDQLKTKDLLLDILSMKSYVVPFLNKGKPYNKTLKFLIETESLYNEDTPLPSLKDISEAIGISYGKVRKDLHKIHEDILGQEDEAVSLELSFNEVEYEFMVTGTINSNCFRVKDLPVIPKVRENVNFPFFSSYLGTSLFYVSSVLHFFEDQKQIVQIKLTAGLYSLYWDLRKSKAYSTGEINLNDIIEKNDYTLKRELLIEKREEKI